MIEDEINKYKEEKRIFIKGGRKDKGEVYERRKKAYRRGKNMKNF